MFAATPPLEAKKVLFSMAVTKGIGFESNRMNGMKIDFIDVRRAYFHGPARRKVYIELPEEDWEEGMCGELNRNMKSTVHSIYGKNGSLSLLKSNKFSITDIFTMEGGSAYKDKALRAQINKSKCRAISLSKDEFNKRFGHKRTQGIVVNFILTYR